MVLPNLAPDAELDHIPFEQHLDHAASFTATITDPGGDTIIFTTNEQGKTVAISDRRKGDDRRVRTRRFEDHEAARAADADRIEDIKAQTRRGWTMLCIGYVIGLVSAVAMFVATS